MTLSRINHLGAASPTGLQSSITATSTSLTLNNATGYPSTNFVIKIDAGTVAEEKILVGSRSGTTCTSLTRGYDGTSATAHSSAPNNVEHDLAAVVIDDANDHIYTTSRDDHTQYARTDGTRAFSGGVTITTGGLTVSAGGAALTGALTVSQGITAQTLLANQQGTARFLGANAGPPNSGTFQVGDYVVDTSRGMLWLCTTAGTPGTWIPIGTGWYVFRQHLASAVTSVGNYVQTQIAYDTVDYNPAGMTVTSAQLVVPVAGYWEVVGQFGFSASGSGQEIGVNITKNGAATGQDTMSGMGSGMAMTAQANDIVECAANDKLGVGYSCSTASLASFTGVNAYMTARLVAHP